MPSPIKTLFSIALLAAATGQALAQTSQPSAPISTTAPWSQRIADSVLARHPKGIMIEQKNEDAVPKWSYSTSFLVRAVAQTGVQSGDQKYITYARDFCDAFINNAGMIDAAKYQPDTFKLDDIAPGCVYLLIYRQTGQPQYLAAATQISQQFKGQPRTSEGGFWHKKVYPHQMWLDGIFMDCPFMSSLGNLTNTPAWFDEAARQIILIAAHTQDPKTGLCYHGWDESKEQQWANKTTGLSACFWGRAVGWYSAGIVDTLDYLPPDHPRRAEILAILNKLAAGIKNTQDPATGLWYQVLDQPHREKNYLEASASSMFVYTLAKAARKGYLDPAYAQVAAHGYQGILQHLVEVEPATGLVNLKDTCQVAGLGGKPYRDGTYDYYMSEKRATNDPKGLAPFILASLEMEQLAGLKK